MSIVIGIDASRAFKKQKTGVEWYTYYVIDQLIKKGENNRYIFYFSPYFVSKIPHEWQNRQNGEIKILRWPFKYLWTQGRLSLEMLFHSPDVLFIPASAMSIIYPKNTVAVIHDVGFMKFPEAYGKWQRWYLKWSTQFAVKHAKTIITISEFSKNEIIKYFNADENNVEVVPLAHDSQRFKVIHDKERIREIMKKYNITEPFFLFVGRLEKKKNVDRLIKAFAILKKSKKTFNVFEDVGCLKFLLVGNNGYGWEEIEKLIKDEHLECDIIRLGYVPDEDLPYLYNAAELFIFPSLYEGFGMPILEAMACGVPVITSNTSSCPEVSGDCAVLVDPQNPEMIAEKIAEVLTNNELKQRMVEKGLERVKKFSWEKCAERTLSVISMPIYWQKNL